MGLDLCVHRNAVIPVIDDAAVELKLRGFSIFQEDFNRVAVNDSDEGGVKGEDVKGSLQVSGRNRLRLPLPNFFLRTSN